MPVGKGVGSCCCKDKKNCPQCCTRCFQGELLGGNPEAAEIGIKGIYFDIGIQPPPCCAGLEGEHHLAWDAASGIWKDGYYSIALDCSEDCEGKGGTITPVCAEAGSPWTYDGEKWTGSSAGENGFGCLQAGIDENGGFRMHYGATLQGQVDMVGGTVAELVYEPEAGMLTFHANGTFTYKLATPSDTITYANWGYQVLDGEPGARGVSILIFPQPRVDVWLQKTVTPEPGCCPDQQPPIPPGPYPPVPPPPGYPCCTDWPGAIVLIPKQCVGTLGCGPCYTACNSAVSLFINPYSTGSGKGCAPFVCAFDRFAGFGAVYTGTPPTACNCGEGGGPNPEYSFTLGCGPDGPALGFVDPWGFPLCSGSFGCNLEKVFDAYCFGIMNGYGNCPNEDFGCLECLKGETGAPDTDCWIKIGGRGAYGVPCSGGRVDSIGFWIMAL